MDVVLAVLFVVVGLYFVAIAIGLFLGIAAGDVIEGAVIGAMAATLLTFIGGLLFGLGWLYSVITGAGIS